MSDALRRFGDYAAPDPDEETMRAEDEAGGPVEVAGRQVDPDDDMDYGEDLQPERPRKRVPHGNIYEAARAGDIERLKVLIEEGMDVNTRDRWDSVPLYYACLAGHKDAVKMLLEAGAICSENTFDGDRCHYASLTTRIRKILKAYEMRPPPIDPLPRCLRELFNNDEWCPDIVFWVGGRPIKAHRMMLSARSAYFRQALRTKWLGRNDIWLTNPRLTYPALFAFIQYIYSDRLEVAVDDLEDLARICKVCQLHSLREAIDREIVHQRYADYKALRSRIGGNTEDCQRRFIIQASSLPPEDRLPAGMLSLLQRSREDSEASASQSDLCFSIRGRLFPVHRQVLMARSEYFRTLFERTSDFQEGGWEALRGGGGGGGGAGAVGDGGVPVIPVQDMSVEAFTLMLEYLYTDTIRNLDLDLAEEVMEAASRYLLFPLQRAVAEALLPQLDSATPAELCNWLLMADLYGVWKLREFCLDKMAMNFDAFEDLPEFRAMVKRLPLPNREDASRTTAPNAPGQEGGVGGIEYANVLDDLREKWVEVEGDREDRDKGTVWFENRLLELRNLTEMEEGENEFGEIITSNLQEFSSIDASQQSQRTLRE